MAQPVLPAPLALQGVAGVEPGPIPTARALRLAEDPCPHRQPGGRAQGRLLLDSFLATRGEPYRAAMSSPLTGERACSRLSPHLALGTLSLREVVQAAAARQAGRPGGRWPGALASFQARLAWRDHFIQKLEDQPGIETHCLHRAAEALRPREPDAARLAAWEAGETGLPFLDACLRYLAATGWLNFPDAQHGDGGGQLSPVAGLAGHRGDPGAAVHRLRTRHPLAAGADAVGDDGDQHAADLQPVKQGWTRTRPAPSPGPGCRNWRRCRTGSCRRPGPGRVRARCWAGATPAPVVDVAAAQRAARDAVFGLRRAADRAEIAAIVDRHASRADPRFVNDRAPRRRPPAPTGQLSLDL